MRTKKKLAAEIEALRDELSVVRAQLEALQADAIKTDWAQSLKIMGFRTEFPLTTLSLDSEDEPFR